MGRYSTESADFLPSRLLAKPPARLQKTPERERAKRETPREKNAKKAAHRPELAAPRWAKWADNLRGQVHYESYEQALSQARSASTGRTDASGCRPPWGSPRDSEESAKKSPGQAGRPKSAPARGRQGSAFVDAVEACRLEFPQHGSGKPRWDSGVGGPPARTRSGLRPSDPRLVDSTVHHSNPENKPLIWQESDAFSHHGSNHTKSVDARRSARLAATGTSPPRGSVRKEKDGAVEPEQSLVYGTPAVVGRAKVPGSQVGSPTSSYGGVELGGMLNSTQNLFSAAKVGVERSSVVYAERSFRQHVGRPMWVTDEKTGLKGGGAKDPGLELGDAGLVRAVVTATGTRCEECVGLKACEGGMGKEGNVQWEMGASSGGECVCLVELSRAHTRGVFVRLVVTDAASAPRAVRFAHTMNVAAPIEEVGYGELDLTNSSPSPSNPVMRTFPLGQDVYIGRYLSITLYPQASAERRRSGRVGVHRIYVGCGSGSGGPQGPSTADGARTRDPLPHLRIPNAPGTQGELRFEQEKGLRHLPGQVSPQDLPSPEHSPRQPDLKAVQEKEQVEKDWAPVVGGDAVEEPPFHAWMLPTSTKATIKLHWHKLPEAAVAGTIWQPKGGSSLAEMATNVNYTLLQDQFALSRPTHGHSSDERPEEVFRRLQHVNNMAAFLEKAQVAPSELHRAILNVDDNLINAPDVLESLATFTPTETEIAEVRLVAQDPSCTLSQTDNLQLELASIPLLEERIRAFIFLSAFNKTLTRIQTDTSAVESACRELRSSPSLRVLFRVILAMGNFLNAGSRYGHARGFRLDILPRLKDIRATHVTTQRSLLHVVAKEALVHSAGATQVAAELSLLGAASEVSLTELTGMVSSLQTEVKHLQAVVGAIGELEAVDGDRFLEVMRPFLEATQQMAEKVQVKLVEAKCRYAEVVRYLHGELPTKEPAEFLFPLVSFLTDLATAEKENEAVREAVEAAMDGRSQQLAAVAGEVVRKAGQRARRALSEVGRDPRQDGETPETTKEGIPVTTFKVHSLPRRKRAPARASLPEVLQPPLSDADNPSSRPQLSEPVEGDSFLVARSMRLVDVGYSTHGLRVIEPLDGTGTSRRSPTGEAYKHESP